MGRGTPAAFGPAPGHLPFGRGGSGPLHHRPAPGPRKGHLREPAGQEGPALSPQGTHRARAEAPPGGHAARDACPPGRARLLAGGVRTPPLPGAGGAPHAGERPRPSPGGGRPGGTGGRGGMAWRGFLYPWRVGRPCVGAAVCAQRRWQSSSNPISGLGPPHCVPMEAPSLWSSGGRRWPGSWGWARRTAPRAKGRPAYGSHRSPRSRGGPQ
jgi:hypothetical protein